PEKAILDNNSWYGALYYNIIDNGNNIFTLLGWNGYNAQTNQKIIEVLSFSTEGNPVFGKAVFANYPSIQTRILFRYSAKTTFSLKYEEVKMLIEKNRILKFRKGSRIVKRKFPLIAFNKLEPMNKGFNSNYKYYIPLTETINAFRYKNGKWLFMEDITIITEKKKSRKKREPKMNLFPKKQD
ncbi:MAG: hypothetical protein U9R32_03940, partial [Bacteroidota bacterium]|nr:hypothetical protein [Bacteroidota bacterium]